MCFVFAHPISPESQLTSTLAPLALGMPPASIGYSPWRLAQAAKWATVDWANSTFGAEIASWLLFTALNAHRPEQGLARGMHSVLFVELKA